MTEGSTVQASPKGDPRDSHFETTDLLPEIRQHSIRGSAASITAQVLKVAIQVGSAAVIARLVRPDDYGLVAMSMLVVGFIQVFGDFGLASAAVQSRTLSHYQASSLLWLNVLVGTLLSLAGVLAGPVLARFFGEPRLIVLTAAMSTIGVIVGLAGQHEALLRRRMRFHTLAIVDVSAALTAAIIAIVLAAYGAGYWAIAAQIVLLQTVRAIMLWSSTRWIPSLPRRNQGVRRLLRVGGNVTASFLMNYAGRNIDNLLIGRFFGAPALGLYSRAYQLFMVPINQISTPVFSVMTASVGRLQDDATRLQRWTTSVLELFSLGLMPVVAMLIGTSDWVVELLLGPQWSESATLLAALGFAAFLQPIEYVASSLLMARAEARPLLMWNLVSNFITVLAVIVGLQWGILGVAVSYSISQLVRTPIFLMLLERKTPYRAVDAYRAFLPPLGAAFSGLTVVWGLRALWPFGSAYSGILVCVPCGLAVYIAVLMLLPGGARRLRAARSTVGSLGLTG